MAKIVMTYAELEEVLKGLGFSVQVVEGKGRIYRHAPTGALIPFPARPLESVVLPHHLAAVRGVLREYGFGDLDDFTNGSAAGRKQA